jgi:hypothetical protein
MWVNGGHRTEHFYFLLTFPFLVVSAYPHPG